jgi:hypothetical protein
MTAAKQGRPLAVLVGLSHYMKALACQMGCRANHPAELPQQEQLDALRQLVHQTLQQPLGQPLCQPVAAQKCSGQLRQ